MTHPIQFLWATPRTVSTAFERMMIERGDHVVYDEPFSAAYYLGPDRRSTRFAELVDDGDPAEVVDRLGEAATRAPVFVKDMVTSAQLRSMVDRCRPHYA